MSEASHPIATKDRSFAARLGAATGKWFVRVLTAAVFLWVLIWIFNDKLPREVLWFIAGMMVNNLWNDTAEPERDES